MYKPSQIFVKEQQYMIQYHNKIFKEDPLFKFHFEDYLHDEKIVLHLGFDPSLDKVKKNGELNILFDLEQPNSFLHPLCNQNTFICEEFFDKIFTINPFFVESRNKVLRKQLYEYVFFPYSKRYIKSTFEKSNDLIYTGNKDYFGVCQNLMRHHKNFIWIGMDGNKHNVSYEEKIHLTNISKISISHSIIDFSDLQDYINSHQNVVPNVNGIIEQHKARTIESAFNKSIIVHIKTGQNIIEDFFKEGVDFLYYEEGIINEILNHYEDYLYLSENAHKKAIENYTTEHFYDRFIKPLI